MKYNHLIVIKMSFDTHISTINKTSVVSLCVTARELLYQNSNNLSKMVFFFFLDLGRNSCQFLEM